MVAARQGYAGNEGEVEGVRKRKERVNWAVESSIRFQRLTRWAL
jgi:hypothetical protein